MTMQDKHTKDSDKRLGFDDLPLFASRPAPPSLKVLRLPEVTARVGLKRASIYQYIQTGRFPKPVPLGPRAVGWLEHEVEAWLVTCVKNRRVKQGNASA
jgi:prophage regulatory protein